MPKIVVTITKEELNQLVAKQLNLSSDIDVVVVESCEDKSDQNGWITWNGGECPVGDDKTVVEVEFRNGNSCSGVAKGWRWSDRRDDWDIIAYRVVKE